MNVSVIGILRLEARCCATMCLPGHSGWPSSPAVSVRWRLGMSNARNQLPLFFVLSLAPFPSTAPLSFIIIAMARVVIMIADRTAVLRAVYLSVVSLRIVLAVLGGSNAEVGEDHTLRFGDAWVRVVELSSLTCDIDITMVIASMAI